MHYIDLLFRFLFFLPVWPLCLVGYYKHKEYVDADLKGIHVPSGGGQLDTNAIAEYNIPKYLLLPDRMVRKDYQSLYARARIPAHYDGKNW